MVSRPSWNVNGQRRWVCFWTDVRWTSEAVTEIRSGHPASILQVKQGRTVFGRFPLGSRHYCYLLQKLAYFETRILYDRKQAPGFTFQFANDFPARIAQISVRRIWLNVVNMVRAWPVYRPSYATGHQCFQSILWA